MVRVKKPSWYSFELNDYSAPSCTSFTKTYFGTIEDFNDVVLEIPFGIEEELKDTFERFAAGERKIIYNAGYINSVIPMDFIIIFDLIEQKARFTY